MSQFCSPISRLRPSFPLLFLSSSFPEISLPQTLQISPPSPIICGVRALQISNFLPNSPIVIRKALTSSPIIPFLVKPLLEEFSNVFLNDLSHALPPMLHIQHAIDLVPGSSLPHLTHNKLSPSTHAKLSQ